MIKIFLIFAAALLFLNSCKQTPKQESTEMITIENAENGADDMITTIYTDNDGKILNLSFNNSKGSANIYFNGELIELVQQKSASRIWYKNNNYELSGKGKDIELKKDGQVVFEYKEEIINASFKDKEGRTLDMTFNNTSNKVKIYLNGGKEMELEGQKAASGIWYKNDEYELRGKGENLELSKNGKTLFKS